MSLGWRTNLKLAFAGVFFILLTLGIMMFADHRIKKTKNFWTDGKKAGDELTQDEKEGLRLIKIEIEKFKDSFTVDEKNAYNKANARFLKKLEEYPGKYIDYRKFFFKDKEEKMIVKKMFYWRKYYRQDMKYKIAKAGSSALNKLTLKQKLELTGGFILP